MENNALDLKIKNNKNVLLIGLLFVFILFIYFTRESFLNNYIISTDQSNSKSYVNFVSRNPIINSNQDSDNNGIEDWNDSLNQEYNKKLNFEKSDDNLKDFETNLTDIIASDLAVADVYIKNGKATEAIYDVMIDNLVMSSRYTLADAGDNIKFISKDNYTAQEEKEFLKNINDIYVYLMFEAFSEVVLSILEKEELSSKDKILIEKNYDFIKKICITLNDPNIVVVGKYKSEYESLLQTCFDSLFVYNAILKKNQDPARVIVAATILTDMNVEIYNNLNKIKQKIPSSIKVSDFILLKK